MVQTLPKDNNENWRLTWRKHYPEVSNGHLEDAEGELINTTIAATEDRSNAQMSATIISKYMEVIAYLIAQMKTKDAEIKTLLGGGKFTENAG